MGYRFPKRRVTSREPPDPAAFRETVQNTVEELGGNVNEHNVTAQSLATNRYPTKLFYDFHYASQESDPGIHVAVPPIPNQTSPTCWVIPDGGEWAAVGNMTVTYTAGAHTVWAIGMVNYGINTAISLSQAAFDKPRVQFAIRINGVVIEETISGTERPDEGAPRHIRPVTPISPNAVPFTPPDVHNMRTLDYSTARTTGSMSWHVRAVRVQCQWVVPQGETTVEIVARRVIADDDSYILASAYPVVAYNRRLLAVEMKMGGDDASAGQSIPVTYPVDGDLISADNLGFNLMVGVTSAENALGIDAIKRAGLRHEHFTLSPVLFSKTTEYSSGNTTARAYPGWGGTGTVGVGNWDRITNNAAAALSVPVDDGSGNWNFTTNPGFVLILGNVHYTNTKHNGGLTAGAPADYQVLGISTVFASAATAMSQVDQTWTNNPNERLNAVPTYAADECKTDSPFFSFFDFRSAPPAAGAVAYFNALVTRDGQATDTYWENNHMLVMIFRP